MQRFLDAARSLPTIQFCLLNVDSLGVTVRDQLVGYVFDPEHPLTSSVDNGVVLVFRSQVGLDAFGTSLRDVTPGSMLKEPTIMKSPESYFVEAGLSSRLSKFTIVTGRAGVTLRDLAEALLCCMAAAKQY